KSDLDRVLDVAKRLYNLELVRLCRARVTSVHIVAAAPLLPPGQWNALQLAIRSGYYSYPRKTALAALARRSQLAPSTFHAHLRKAENKLMPHLSALCGSG